MLGFGVLIPNKPDPNGDEATIFSVVFKGVLGFGVLIPNKPDPNGDEVTLIESLKDIGSIGT